MATPDNPVVVSRPRGRAWRIFLIGATVSLILAAVVFFGLGRWLVVEDPLVKAQAIVVLSGAMPLRAIEAAKLYHEGYAPEIWLTRSAEPGETLKEMGISFSGEDYYDKLVLIHEGVPADAIHVLGRSEEHTSELQSPDHLVCRLLLEKKKKHAQHVHLKRSCAQSRTHLHSS